ncbi:hypothetical protein EDD22DRAFT_1048294 [Suillus occidentalis]|nr:hypothetical protein EDD22DRAFT_1048294 [Suillus occidentalis]
MTSLYSSLARLRKACGVRLLLLGILTRLLRHQYTLSQTCQDIWPELRPKESLLPFTGAVRGVDGAGIGFGSSRSSSTAFAGHIRRGSREPDFSLFASQHLPGWLHWPAPWIMHPSPRQLNTLAVSSGPSGGSGREALALFVGPMIPQCPPGPGWRCHDKSASSASRGSKAEVVSATWSPDLTRAGASI